MFLLSIETIFYPKQKEFKFRNILLQFNSNPDGVGFLLRTDLKVSNYRFSHGFLDFLEKIGGFFGFRNFSEEDRYIKAIYAVLSEAEEELKKYNETTKYGNRQGNDRKNCKRDRICH